VKLRFVSGLRRGELFTLSGPTLRIGRSRDNDIVLPDDSSEPHTSGHHAELVLDGGAWTLRDLDSTNGTFLDGVRITREKLRTGDEIGFGGDALLMVETERRAWWPMLVAAAAVFAALAVFATLRSKPDFQSTAERITPSVYLVALERDGERAPVGTAFVVDASGLLVTNAHVAELLDGEERAVVLGADLRGVAREVVRSYLHESFEAGSFQDDVALLELEAGPRLSSVTLASDRHLAKLGRGVSLATLGFPAPATNPSNPRARLLVEALADLKGEDYLKLERAALPGTSGSPVFDRDGIVVGIVVGRDEKLASDASWALSAAVIRELLSDVQRDRPRRSFQ
jgi:S1-C subfamily serine protease